MPQTWETGYWSLIGKSIRFCAYNLAGLVGSKSTNEAVRKEAVSIMFQGCKDKDSGVSGQCSQALQQFQPKDFDAAARLQLGSLLVVGTSYLNQVAKIAGYVGEPQGLNRLYSRKWNT